MRMQLFDADMNYLDRLRWSRYLRLLQIGSGGQRPPGRHHHLGGVGLVTIGAQLDVVPSGFESEMVRKAVEIIDSSGERPVDVDPGTGRARAESQRTGRALLARGVTMLRAVVVN